MNIRLKTPAIIVNGKNLRPIDLYDTITLKKINEQKIHLLKKTGYKFPTNRQSPVYQVAHMLQRQKPNKLGVTITIQKNIPTQCGLFSQLSNAAGVLMGLNELWGFKMSERKLACIARSIHPTMAIILKNFLHPKKQTIGFAVLVRPQHIKIDTTWLKKIKKNRPPAKVIGDHFPDLNQIMTIMRQGKAFKTGLSGNKSMVFGLFKNREDIKKIKKEDFPKQDFFWKGSTCNTGAKLLN